MLRAAVLVALSLVLIGSAAPAPGAAASRELRIALTQEPGTLDPIGGTLAVETDVFQFIFSGLTRFNERGEPVPDLATRVPTQANGDITPDGRTITYHLVHNAKWHDGVPVTSADVAFTFAAIMNDKNNVVNRDPYEMIDRVETPDPYTVRIKMKRPWAPMIDAFTDRNDGAILPAHLLKDLPDLNHADFNAAPIGSGPYKFVAWHRGSDIELVANPDYFRGKPKIDRVSIRFLVNDNTMSVALRTRDVDIGDRLDISTYENLGSIPGMLPAINAQTYWEHLTFNTRRPPLDDVRVRRALCYGFDVHEIFAKVSHGLGLLGPSSENPALPWYNRKLSYYPFDPARAGKLLDDAGWKMGPNGIRMKDGQPLALTLSITAGNANREETGVILQSRWKAIGVDLAIKTYPPAMFFAQAANGGPFYGGKTDIALSAFINTSPDPNEIAVNSATFLPPHGNNLSFWTNAEVTKLEAQGAQTLDQAARKKIYDRIQELEVRDVPYYVLRWSAITDMRDAALEGVKPSVVGSTFWNIAGWTFR